MGKEGYSHMTKHCKMLLILSIVLILSLGLVSCNNDQPPPEEEQTKAESWDEGIISADPEGATYDYFFDSVEDLLVAIKHHPEEYNNAKVKVVGTLQTGLSNTLYETRLVDFTAKSTNTPSSIDGVMDGYNFRKVLDNSDGKIDIIISNDEQFAVAEDGDYVKVYGTVKITRDAIYIDGCEYDLIATLKERRENIDNQ